MNNVKPVLRLLRMARKPELVILDLGLPGMDGIAVIRKVREWSVRWG